MIIYINFSDYQSSRDLQLLKMFQFEKGNSFHPKTVVSHLKAAKPMYKADRIMVAQCIQRNKSFNDQFTEGRVTYTLFQKSRCTYSCIFANKCRHVLFLRCFDTVFQRPYRYFSIALKVVFSLSDRYKIFTNNWLWIEICENVVLSKIDITMTTINKTLWN